jgi:hypothetical protein
MDPRFTTRSWEQPPRWAIFAWMAFYAIFIVYVLASDGGFLFIDYANLVVHEGGHLLFGWFGATLGIWGGTILQWSVPALLAVYFYIQRKMTAFVFCTFFFFENWLYTATYMADARAMALPLVTVGDPDYVEHDWNTIFSSLGILQYDLQIAACVRFLGRCGMLACVAWLAYWAWTSAKVAPEEPVKAPSPLQKYSSHGVPSHSAQKPTPTSYRPD